MGKYCLPLISKPLNCKKVMKRQGRLPILLFALFFCAPSLYAHGGRTIDQDRCVFRTGGMLMHFTAYQPSTSVKDELCRDLPSTNSTIVIIDLVDEALRNIPINIVVKSEAEEAITVFQTPGYKIFPTGTTSFSMSALAAGKYSLNISLDQASKHSHNGQVGHETGAFLFQVTSKASDGSPEGLFEKYKWILFLLTFGYIIYFLSSKYKNK